jgi:hypothetical protein
MNKLTEQAREKSTYPVQVVLKDEDGVVVTAATMRWSLTRFDNGEIVNARERVVVVPATATVIVLTGLDLAIMSDEIDQAGAGRCLTIEATFNSTLGAGLPVNDSAYFVVRNLCGIV